jgi:hypothetical protein
VPLLSEERAGETWQYSKKNVMLFSTPTLYLSIVFKELNDKGINQQCLTSIYVTRKNLFPTAQRTRNAMTKFLELEIIAVCSDTLISQRFFCGQNGEILNINSGFMYMFSNIQSVEIKSDKF